MQFQYVGRVLGVAHEPGYPQYVLLTHLWSLLPWPFSLAVQINLFSAVLTSLAGVFAFRTMEDLGASIWASFLATATLLTSLDVWILATQAEVYSLNLFWVSVVLWTAVRWHSTRRELYLVLLFFAYALSFGNHLTMIVLLPGLAYLILATDRRVVRRWQTWAWATCAISLGLAQYGLLVWRSYHPHPTLLPRFPLEASLPELWSYVTGGSFVDRHLLKSGASAWPGRFWMALRHGVGQISLPLALCAALGSIVAFRRDRVLALAFAILTACLIAFAAAYGIIDSLYYALPAWLVLTLWSALGLDLLLARMGRAKAVVLALLVVLLTVRMSMAVGELRLDRPPADLLPVIESAEPGSGILTGRRDRTAHLAEGYYRYGLELDKAGTVSYHSTSEVYATGVEGGDFPPLYFQEGPIARELEKRWVDTRAVPSDTGTTGVFVNRAESPIDELRLRPLWNRTLALVLRDQSRDLTGPTTIHLLVIDGVERRSKGLVSLDTELEDQWTTGLDDALEAAAPEDWLLLVVPARAIVPHAELAQRLSRFDIELGDKAVEDHVIVLWQKEGVRRSYRLATDLTEELTLSLR